MWGKTIDKKFETPLDKKSIGMEAMTPQILRTRSNPVRYVLLGLQNIYQKAKEPFSKDPIIVFARETKGEIKELRKMAKEIINARVDNFDYSGNLGYEVTSGQQGPMRFIEHEKEKGSYETNAQSKLDRMLNKHGGFL